MTNWKNRTSGAKALISPAFSGTAEAVPFVQSLPSTCKASISQSRHRAERQDGVQSTKSEGLRKSNFYLCLPGAVGNHIQVTFRIRLRAVRGRGQAPVARGQPRGSALDRPRRSQGVTVHGFGRTYGQGRGVAPENVMDGCSLHAVIGLSCGSVSIDVANLLGGQTAISQRGSESTGSAFGGRLGDVACIGRHAEAYDLRQWLRSASQGALERLQNQHGGAFPQDHSGAVGREGPAGIGADHAHRFPGLQSTQEKRRFTASGNGQGSCSGTHHPE